MGEVGRLRGGRMARARSWVGALALLLACALAHADVSELLKQGDAYDAKLDNTHALESYLQAEKLGDADADTLTHIARQYALLMNDTTSDDEQKRLGERALAYSKRAVAASPEHAKSLLSVAICYG